MYKGDPEDLEVGLGGYNPSADHDVPTVPLLPEVALEKAPDYMEVGRLVSSTERRRSSWKVLRHFVWSSAVLRNVKYDKDVMSMRRSQAHDQSHVHDHQEAEPRNAVVATATLPSGGFAIGSAELAAVVGDRSLQALNQYDKVQGLSILLKSDLEKGIDRCDYEIQQRKQAFGSNTYPCKKGKTFWCFIWKASQFLPYLAITLAVVINSLLRIKRKSIRDGLYVEVCTILAIVLHIVLTATTEYWHSRQFEKLTEKKRNVQLEVIRGGRRDRVSIYDIVVGDIVPLKNGFQVPADGILCKANSLKIDEKEITGSHTIVDKDLEKDPFLLSCSKVIEGIGKMMVTSVGMNTKWGLKMEIQHESDEENPFQVRLKFFANAVSCLVVLLASFVFILQLCRYFSGQTKKLDGNPMFIHKITTAHEAKEFVIRSLSFGIETIKVAFPVGLSIAVLLNLATVRKMMTDNAMVQKLSSCERMGSVTTILCHKTGILTLNKMSVVDVWAGGKRMQDMDNLSQLPTSLKELIIEGISQNTNGSVVLEAGVIEPEVYGSPTEQAILSFGNKLGMNFDEARSASLVYHTIPFNPNKKYGGVALELGTRAHIHWKGSAKTILSSCEEYKDGDNNSRAIDEQQRQFFEETIENMCMRGMRCAALAYRPYELGSLPTAEEISTLPRNHILLAIIGIKDPCREGTRDAIQLCNSGGVKVCMLTEDDVLTAQAIAMECGILRDNSGLYMKTGAQFRCLSDVEREQIAGDILVFAQSSPSDILLLVKALKGGGHVVAATGMGIHDPKILQAADVSLAMGIGGTAAAKENSDIIILDDDFATIVKIIQWCRYLYTNIQRYVLYRLTVSLSAVVICVVEVAFHDAFPLNAMQLLWINLVIDIFGAFTLVYKPTGHHLMGKPPVGRRDPLITKTMWSKLGVQVIYLVLSLVFNKSDRLLELTHGHTGYAEKMKNTFMFISFVFCLGFGEFEIRSVDQTVEEIIRDNLFLIKEASTLIFQIVLFQFLAPSNPALKLDLKKWLVRCLLGLLRSIVIEASPLALEA